MKKVICVTILSILSVSCNRLPPHVVLDVCQTEAREFFFWSMGGARDRFYECVNTSQESLVCESAYKTQKTIATDNLTRALSDCL